MKKKKLNNILWSLLALCYIIVLKADFILTHWIGFLIGLFIIVLLLILVKYADKYKKGTRDYIIYDLVPKIIYSSPESFLLSIFLMFFICTFSVMFVIFVLEKYHIVELGKELRAYTFLTIASMLITFYGKTIVTILNRYMIFNPSESSVKKSQQVVSEDIIKVIIFSLYFIMLIISAIVKFKKNNILELSEENINPVILAFTTYIALDRIVTTFRRAREIKL